jgi:calpain-15
LEAAYEEAAGNALDDDVDVLDPPTVSAPQDANVFAQQLVNAFNLYDVDKTGTLNIGELYGVLVFALGNSQLQFNDIVNIMRFYDQSNDGVLSIEEFLAIFFNTGPVAPAPAPTPIDEDDEHFTDADFPPDAGSLGNVAAFPPSQANWVRAPDLTPGEDKLFFNIEPNDISQGYLGDCWLLACLSCAAEFPGLIEQLFLDKVLTENGKYRLKLFDGNQWQEIVIDDFIPCLQGQPAFSKPHDNELWVLLAEKAVAKLCGSYAAMEGGMFGAGFMMFTGCKDQFFFANMEGMSSPWQKMAQTYDPPTKAGNIVGNQPVGDLSSDEFWDYLKDSDRRNFLMGAGTFKEAPSSGQQGFSGGEDIRLDGIVKGHAYSMIQVKELQADGETMKMLQLRNPWGNDKEWAGAFSDHSDDWATHPELAEALGFEGKDDGLFWMTWDDFVDCMSFVCVGEQSIPTPKRNVLKRSNVPTAPENHNRFDRHNPTSSGKKSILGTCQACAPDCVVM